MDSSNQISPAVSGAPGFRSRFGFRAVAGVIATEAPDHLKVAVPGFDFALLVALECAARNVREKNVVTLQV